MRPLDASSAPAAGTAPGTGAPGTAPGTGAPGTAPDYPVPLHCHTPSFTP